MQETITSPETILDFWFEEHGPQHWFAVDPAFDQRICARFAATHRAASSGQLYLWRATPAGRLAEILILDQFSRNIHRGSASAFACDGMALVLAQEAVASRVDTHLTDQQRQFIYLPWMHSESLLIHDQATHLFASLDDGGHTLGFEKDHRAVLERFGRYPTRNQAVGRVNTPEEDAYLAQHQGGAV